jgi:hypothetical protein
MRRHLSPEDSTIIRAERIGDERKEHLTVETVKRMYRIGDSSVQVTGRAVLRSMSFK